MIKINNEEVIFSECILIDGLAETWVTIPHKNDPIKMCIAFEEIVDKTAKKEDSSFVKVEGKKDHDYESLDRRYHEEGYQRSKVKL